VDKFQHECAVFGIYGDPKASLHASWALHMMQHRGQEAAGIATWNGGNGFHLHKETGRVRTIFTGSVLGNLPGQIAIGHNRYSTCGPNTPQDTQPHLYTSKQGVEIVGASNGDLPGYAKIRSRLEAQGYELKSNNDAELIVALIAFYLDQNLDEVEAIKCTMQELRGGAYSCVFIINGKLFAFRDPRGFRPLVLGRHYEAYVVASETVAFDILGADYIREIEPGQIVRIDGDRERSFEGVRSDEKSFCIFELIYFSRPDSWIFGHSVSRFRKREGDMLWRLHKHVIRMPPEEYVVISVPDSSNHIALGFSQSSGLAFDFGLVRHHYAVREFIEAGQAGRDEVVKFKNNPDKAVVKGKRVIVIDDSIVRSTTIRKLVRMLRLAGAIEVIVLIGSPPITHSCFYGIDTPTQAELVASQMEVEGIRNLIEADYLGYLTIEGLLECTMEPSGTFCLACFNGEYPEADTIPEEKLKVLE